MPAQRTRVAKNELGTLKSGHIDRIPMFFKKNGRQTKDPDAFARGWGPNAIGPSARARR